jgi:hypothetical protein
VDVNEFLDAHHDASLSPLQRALALDAAADAKSAADDRREEAARHAAAEERTELLTLANRQGHDPVGELRRFRADAMAADDLVRDLSDRLAKATARRDRINENMQSLTRQVDSIHAAVASRSAPVMDGLNDLLAPARRAHAEYVTASRAAWQATQAGKAPCPFAAGGVAVRGEMCPECAAAGASEAESFLIHADPAPEPVPADFDESQLAGYRYEPDEAERYRAGRRVEAVISR